jgi:hypothetical protein
MTARAGNNQLAHGRGRTTLGFAATPIPAFPFRSRGRPMNLRRAALCVWVTQGLSLVFRVFEMMRYGYEMYDMYGGSLFRQSLFLLPDAALVLFFFILWTELKKR